MVKTSEILTHPLQTKDASKHLFRILHILGILMPKRYKVPFIILSFIWNFFRVFVIPVMFTVSYFDSSEMQINNFLSSLQACLNAYGCSIKFIVVIYLRQCFFEIESIFDKLDTRIRHRDEIREAHEAVRFGKSAVLFFVTSFFCWSTASLLGSIYIGQPTFWLYTPYLDWHNSQLSFLITCGIEYFVVNVALLQQLANDTYAVIYIGVLRSQFKILIMRVLRIGTDPNSTKKDNEKELVRCIHDHWHILKVIDVITPIMSLTYFIQIALSVTILAITLINITITNDKSTIIGSGVYVIALMFQIFPICYIVNALVAESDRLPQAIFHMNWIDQSLTFRRSCVIFMHRSQQSIVFYAGKLFPISLESFVSIVKFAFSVYTLLENMDLATKFNM